MVFKNLFQNHDEEIPERFYTCLLDNLIISYCYSKRFEEAKNYLDILEELRLSNLSKKEFQDIFESLELS